MVGAIDSGGKDGGRLETELQLIDADLHNDLPSIQSLYPYLSDYWVEFIENTGFSGPADSYYPNPGVSEVSKVPTTFSSTGAYVTADLERLRVDALDSTRPVQHCILNCTYPVDTLHHPDQAVALSSAVNDWQISEWLDKDQRLRASIVVPSKLPALAAAEIDRVGGHPGFVQVLLPARSAHPYGNRLFHPIWEAAARHDLVVGIHFGGAPGNPPTPVGWPSYYLEEYVDMAGVFASQVTSMISEGVFDLYPSLRIALIESGVTWLAPHLWRVDRDWQALRRVVPWVKQPPSIYVQRHFRITTQPFDCASDPELMSGAIAQLGAAAELLMFASDYPHPHGQDDPYRILSQVTGSAAQKIANGNAREWYRL